MAFDAFTSEPSLFAAGKHLVAKADLFGIADGWSMPVARACAPHLRDLPELVSGEHVLVLHLGGAPSERRRVPGGVPILSGAMTLQPAGVPCHWHADGAVTFTHLYFRREFLVKAAADATGAAISGDLIDPLGPIPDRRLASMVREYTERAIDPRLPPTALEMDARALLIGLHVIATQADTPKAPPRPDARITPLPAWRLRRVRDYVEANLDRQIRLDDLAAVAGQSSYYFSRSFKAALGVGPHRYLQARRIDRACALLADRSLTLADVAFACGFSSQAHFTTAFRMLTGTTPGQFRRETEG